MPILGGMRYGEEKDSKAVYTHIAVLHFLIAVQYAERRNVETKIVVFKM
jgi:hypothetical protein